MQYVCDAPGGKTWFRIETESEAAIEQIETHNPVEAFYRDERKSAVQSYRPAPRLAFIERDIALSAHLSQAMPIFLTLRDCDGTALATAVVPPQGKPNGRFQSVVVAPDCGDPFPAQGAAIAALEMQFGVRFDAEPVATVEITLPFEVVASAS